MSQTVTTNVQIRPQSTNQSKQSSEQIQRIDSARPAKQLKATLTPNQIDKEKSHPFFKESKVQCCSYVKIDGGVPKAVPLFQKPPVTVAEKMGKFGVKESLSQEQFKLLSPVFASSKKKPLCRYNPNAPRNMIQQPVYRLPKSNVSQIVFGYEKGQFKTSSNYGNHAQVGFTSNPEVLAHMTKDIKGRINK